MQQHERWLAKAKADLYIAEKILSEKDSLAFEIAMYHTQQCAEKSLKAFLVFRQRPIVKTHDLPYLLILCADLDGDFNKLKAHVLLLNPFSTELRYPGDDFEIDETPSLEIFEATVAAARETFDFVLKKIG